MRTFRRVPVARGLWPVALLLACAEPNAGKPYDLVITNAKIVDGTGNPWYYGDVAIRGDRIDTIGPRHAFGKLPANQRIEANGLVLSPGFIDIQSHSWNALLFADGRVIGKVSQGVTSEILGEDLTPGPSNAMLDSVYMGGDPDNELMLKRVLSFRGEHGFGAWLDSMQANGNTVNVGSYLGAATVRAYAMGQREGPADAAALDTMRAVVRNAMRDGAFGISSALIYPPGAYANTEELIELAKAMAPLNGTYITHIRSEESGLLGAMDEAMRIGKEGGVPVVMYHFKASGRSNWGLAAPAIRKIDSVRATGQDFKATMYPYPASGNNLSSCIPDWAHAEGKLLENLANPANRARLRADMSSTAPNAKVFCQHNPPEAYQVQGFRRPEYMKYQAKRLNEIARDLGKDWVDAIIQLTIDEKNVLSKITFAMSEENVARMIAQPWVVIGSDAGGFDPDTTTAVLHPRAYGSYPRVLGRYVRTDSVLTLEDAVRKMTWSVAQILGLRDRGMVKEGMFADLVIFDPATVIDQATFEKPHQLSVGIRDVFVNGQAVWRDGKLTDARPGRALRGPSYKPVPR